MELDTPASQIFYLRFTFLHLKLDSYIKKKLGANSFRQEYHRFSQTPKMPASSFKLSSKFLDADSKSGIQYTF